MGIFHRFETAKDNETFSVYAISNSTVNDVTYSTNSTYPKGLLYLNVSGSPTTNGICLLIFSKALIEPPYNVTIEEHLPSLVNDLSDDQTAALFFAYSHESLQTSITVTWKISIRVPQDYPTIQEAINAADPGDLIFVHHGTYNESLTVDKEGLQIIGENKLTTIIDLGRATNIRILAGNVTLEGFTIANSRSPYALYVESDGNLITNNIFASNYGGIYCGLADESGPVFDNVIRSNEFQNNSQLSVHLNMAMQNAVSENTFMDNYWGIAVYGGSFDNMICHNTLWRTGSVCIAVQNSPRSTITDNRIDGGTAGIYVDVGSDDTTVSGNELTNVQGIWGVIYLMSNVNVTVKDNNLSGNSGGIYLNHARNAVLTNNSMNDNEYGLGIYGGQLAHYVHSIDSSNTINGKPVYYIINSDDLEINSSTHSEVGFLAVVNSTNIRIEDLTVTRNLQGFLLAYTTLSRLKNVTVAQCFSGIEFYQASDNVLTESNVLNNTYGLRLLQGSTATVCRNNFLNNANKPQCSVPSVWDDGVEGNYWSDYEGEDADLDGLGDIPYLVNADNVDRHPLYGNLSILYAGTWNDTRYDVEIVSNSTILDPFFSVGQKAIGFRVKGEATGFCRITINEVLLKGPYTVEVGGTQVVPLVISNETHSILCFTYVHGVQDVKIEGWEVIPEYSGASASLVPLMLLLLFGLLLAVRKRNS
jgi:parallel beta-helix repeat protein